MDQPTPRDDANDRVIPAFPHQRPQQPTDSYDVAYALLTSPRPKQRGPQDPDHS